MNSEILRILMVEDSPTDIQLTREALSELTFETQLEVIEHGLEAVDFIKQKLSGPDAAAPHLIYLDLNLPGCRGHDILKVIKQSPEHCLIPVIMMSTSKALSDVQKSYALLANAYVTKPLELEDFLYTIKSLTTFWYRTATLPSGADR